MSVDARRCRRVAVVCARDDSPIMKARMMQEGDEDTPVSAADQVDISAVARLTARKAYLESELAQLKVGVWAADGAELSLLTDDCQCLNVDGLLGASCRIG